MREREWERERVDRVAEGERKEIWIERERKRVRKEGEEWR